MNRQTWCAAAVAAAAIVTPARAILTSVSAIDETASVSSVPAGFVVWRIYANASNPLDTLVGVQQTNWTFTGNLFQHSLGGDLPSSPGSDPTLAADSFVTIDALVLPTDAMLDGDFLAPFNGPAGVPPQGGFSGPGNTVRGGWFDGNPATPAAAGADGRVLIAQLTLPLGATGGGPVLVMWAGGNCDPGACPPFQLQIVPGPPSSLLLGFLLGSPRSSRRRRNG